MHHSGSAGFHVFFATVRLFWDHTEFMVLALQHYKVYRFIGNVSWYFPGEKRWSVNASLLFAELAYHGDFLCCRVSARQPGGRRWTLGDEHFRDPNERARNHTFCM